MQLLLLAQTSPRAAEELTPIWGLFGLLALVLVAFIVMKVVRRRDQLREEAEETARKQQIEEGIKLGHLTKDGHPACIICGTAATEGAPVTGLSWMDQVPLLNRLFALPPRYVIVDSMRGLEYCKIHKDVAQAKLEEFHGILRAERGRFNAMQAAQVAKMDGGGLIREVQKHHKGVVEYLNETMEGTERVRHLLPTSTPSSKQNHSEQPVVSTLSSRAHSNPLDFDDAS